MLFIFTSFPTTSVCNSSLLSHPSGRILSSVNRVYMGLPTTWAHGNLPPLIFYSLKCSDWEKQYFPWNRMLVCSPSKGYPTPSPLRLCYVLGMSVVRALVCCCRVVFLDKKLCSRSFLSEKVTLKLPWDGPRSSPEGKWQFS